MVIIALVATMLSDVVAAVFEVMHYGILADLDRGKDLSFETVDNSDVRLAAAYGALGLSFIVTGIAFLAWFHRAYRNLPRLKVWTLRYDFGWAVGGWLIPVFNFVRPKQLANDVWRGSEPVPGPKRLEDHPSVPAIVHVWWGVWVIANLLWTAEAWIGDEVQTLPEQKAATILSMCTLAVSFVAAALAIVVVRKLTKRQTRAIETIIAEGPPPPIDLRWGAQPPLAPGWGQPGWGQPGPWAPPPAWGQAPPPAPPGWGQSPPASPGWGQPPPASQGRQPPPPAGPEWLPPKPPGSG